MDGEQPVSPQPRESSVQIFSKNVQTCAGGSLTFCETLGVSISEHINLTETKKKKKNVVEQMSVRNRGIEDGKGGLGPGEKTTRSRNCQNAMFAQPHDQTTAQPVTTART